MRKRQIAIKMTKRKFSPYKWKSKKNLENKGEKQKKKEKNTRTNVCITPLNKLNPGGNKNGFIFETHTRYVQYIASRLSVVAKSTRCTLVHDIKRREKKIHRNKGMGGGEW